MDGTTAGQLVRVLIPDAKTQKCIVLNPSCTVWEAKQVVLDKVLNELPNDPLNYSLYLPPSGTGKLGKYLDDTLLLANYALQGNIPKLELQYKRRDYRQHSLLTDKAIVKANSKSNQRKLIENIQNSLHKKVDKLLNAGLDPNFTTEDGNTPLGLACGRNRNMHCIQSLINGGAHVDFRGKDGITPMHRAAIGGNSMAINVLLSYGDSPNYRDVKGLTPLYHTAIMGDDIGACQVLLRNRAELEIRDQGGWSELHHTSKYGHIQHAELFIRYGADIDKQNLVGNTPLHVAASHGQMECALVLLKRGADKTLTNYAGQTSSQVAILCGHHQLANEISQFQSTQIERIVCSRDYNENARQFVPKLYSPKELSETCPISPLVQSIVGTLTQEWEEVTTTPEQDFTPQQDLTPQQGLRNNSSTIGRQGSASSRSSSVRVVPPDSIKGDTESISSSYSSSTGGPGTPGPSTPKLRKQSFQQQRERLYRAGPGKYVAIQDVEAQQVGDISLQKGMSVEVTFIGKGGYWEGRVDDAEGWFPRLAIKEMSEEQFDYQTTYDETSSETVQQNKENSSVGRRASNIREIVVTRGKKGYGFAMRGVRATKAMQFHPTPEVPGLQYVGSVEDDGAAANAGLNAGDFIIEVNGHNVTHSTHDEVVDIVKKANSNLLRLRVITPLTRPKSISSHIACQLTHEETNERESSIPEDPVTKDISQSIMICKETVIGQEPTKILRTESPVTIDWSSSQSQGDDSAESGHNLHGMFTHHLPATRTTPHSDSSKVVSYPVQSLSQLPGRYESPSTLDQAHSGPDTENTVKYSAGNSHTLPTVPLRDYPKLDDYASGNSTGSEEEDNLDKNASAFTLALRLKKQRLSQAGTQLRARSNTLPEKVSPLVVRKLAESPETTEKIIPIQEQILNASRAYSDRANANNFRMKSVKNEGQAIQEVFSQNPLAKAISFKIDSMRLLDSEGSDCDNEFDTSPPRQPFKSYIKNRPTQSKVGQTRPLAPTTKPKPPKTNTQRIHMEREHSIETPVKEIVTGNMLDASSSRETIISEDSKKNSTSGGGTDWRSVLKPISEHLSPKSSEKKLHNKSESEKLKPPPVQAKPSPELRKRPLTNISKSVPSLDSTEFELPPPLPVSDAWPSSFINVAPPGAFTLEGVETGESSTDDFIPPPSKLTSSPSPEFTLPPSTSPALPPPLPETSPPPQLTAGPSGIFIFPETTERLSSSPAESDLTSHLSSGPPPASSPISIPASCSIDQLPSPMPSPPTHSSILELLNISGSVVPPPEFGQLALSETTNEERPISPWSPESDISDIPPPPPHDPPPLDWDEPPEDKVETSEQPLSEPTSLSSSAPSQPLGEGNSENIVSTSPILTAESQSGEAESTSVQPNHSVLDLPPPRPPLPESSLSDTTQKQRSPIVDEKQSDVSVEPSQVVPEPLPQPLKSFNGSQDDTDKETDQTSPLTPPQTNSMTITMDTTTPQAPPRYLEKRVEDWNVADVCEWLQDINLAEHTSSFQENEIIGEHLIDIGKDDLKELGVKKLGHQKTFLLKLSALGK